MALITIRSVTAHGGQVFCELTVDNADLGNPIGPDEDTLANARIVSIRVVNNLDYTIDVWFTDPRNGTIRDSRGLSQKIGAPGDKTYTLPTQRNRRVEPRDLLEFGFGGRVS